MINTKRVILMFGSISVIWLAIGAAQGGGTLSQGGTNGTREDLIPNPHSSSIPSDLLTTHSSVTGDSAPLDVVDDDGGDHQATAGWIRGTEGREEEDDKTLGNTLVGLTFEAAVFLMVSSFQPRGRMMLRRGHTGAAIVCTYACILSVAVAFFSMTYVFVADSVAWVVWAAGGILLFVIAYTYWSTYHNQSIGG
ncbi:hypothetical protein RHSIM_RhsimUnG0201200 [Rhododendron simsii]|uniref:Uncharacterized protein n=1 Tax=Rhododendron simsii TaxID=118357 RepID=A0A834L3L3_RHOSS|nr:hypothetical protein RHSIM_RhsimUnG0201200 [Rhododendron simsii]